MVHVHWSRGGHYLYIYTRRTLNKRVRITIFFCRAKREFFFQNLTLGYMTKTLNQIIFFFLHQNQIKYSNDTLGQHRNLSWGKTSFKLLGINFDVDLDKIVNINYNERILQIFHCHLKLMMCHLQTVITYVQSFSHLYHQYFYYPVF
jgi:hypothetical protein